MVSFTHSPAFACLLTTYFVSIVTIFGRSLIYLNRNLCGGLREYHDASEKASRPSLLIRYRNDRKVIPRSRAALCLEP
jgi:hypothetical protein